MARPRRAVSVAFTSVPLRPRAGLVDLGRERFHDLRAGFAARTDSFVHARALSAPPRHAGEEPPERLALEVAIEAVRVRALHGRLARVALAPGRAPGAAVVRAGVVRAGGVPALHVLEVVEPLAVLGAEGCLYVCRRDALEGGCRAVIGGGARALDRVRRNPRGALSRRRSSRCCCWHRRQPARGQSPTVQSSDSRVHAWIAPSPDSVRGARGSRAVNRQLIAIHRSPHFGQT